MACVLRCTLGALLYLGRDGADIAWFGREGEGLRIGGAWLNHPGTQALCAVLGLAGHRILFVGGCVRNTLMMLPVTDIDLATDALPQMVVEVARAAGFKVIPTGIDHGTVTVVEFKSAPKLAVPTE